jgi:acyl-CoA synthetase (AMP-forming)/AMP-acid ligase II
MAETTFAATQTPPGVEARRIRVDRGELASGSVVVSERDDEQSRECVSSGTPISGCALRIVGEDGHDLSPGRVGEVAVRSESLFEGYRNNPDQTRAVLRDGWYFSGDLGFHWEGEYYIIGRKKDIIIVAGKNIYPEDVEDAVGQVVDVDPGRVVAFGVDDPASGTEQVCVVVETGLAEAPAPIRNALRVRIREAGLAIDVTIARVFLAPKRWLVKSSAGKPSRNANKARALSQLTYR